MNVAKKVFFSLAIFSFLLIPFPGSQAQAALPNGTLVRAQGDSRLYYIDNGQRRYIDSPETFRIQGFQSAIVDVSPSDLNAYPEGQIITRDSTLVFPGETDIVPDVAPFAASDLQLVDRDGRKLLLFTTMFWNRGKGPLELDATSDQPVAPDTFETAQRIILPNGQVRNKVVGNLFWHALHKHFHYDDFASYVLELVPPYVPPKVIPSSKFSQLAWTSDTLTPMSSVLGVTTSVPEIRNKSTFCIYETESINLPTEGTKDPKKTYTGCGKYKQGISVGWADKYEYFLPDQNFDVTNLVPGIYRLGFVLDPSKHFMESSRANNISVTFVDINPQAGTMSVLASGSPFYSPNNHFPNGMLVRSEDNPTVYVIQGNRKRAVNKEAVGQIFVLPQGVLDAIPNLSLIQAAGSPTVYLLNANGYRRGITSIESFNSYGLNFADVAVISPTDLANFPETDLIQKQGDNMVYSISTRKPVGNFDSLSRNKLNPASVHSVSQIDFESYMIETVATGLFVPWDVVLLPDGDMLVPERSGTIKRIGKNTGNIVVPSVMSTGEGGLMGVVTHPNFSKNNLIYVYHTTAENGQHNRVIRYRLNGTELTDKTTIIDNIPSAIYHDGGRMAFGPDGMLYITTGDANNPNLAQNLGSLAGKTLRLTPDGEVPNDNPFGTAVWTYGHRNSQGIAWDNKGRMWETEHGRSGAATGYDELNLIEKGKNYGWPTIQGDATHEGMVTPVRNSGPNETWAPAGLAFVDGSLYFSGLLGSALYQVRFQGNGDVWDMWTHFKGRYGRLRAAVVGQDGSLYLSTSNRDGRGTDHGGDDKILRVYPPLLQSFR